MKIYLDLVLMINFLFDFLLLTTVSIILKRNISLTRLLIGAFIGSLSILILFFKITSFQLFIIKTIISFIMTIITFKYRDLKYTLKNTFYLYTTSMILGGFLYFLNIEFSYKQEGLIFFHNGLSINVIFLLIFSPIILYTYIKQIKYLKNNYHSYYKVDIYLDNGTIHCNAFLDTGNKLQDPYFNKPVIILDKKKITYQIDEHKLILVPYKTIDNEGMLKCIKPIKIDIKGVGVKKNLLIGIIEEKIKIDGIDCILNTKLWEE